MTTEAQAHDVINSTLRAITWPGKTPELVLENTVKSTAREYVEAEVMFAQAGQGTMGPVGARRHDYHGVLKVVVNVQVGQGTTRATTLAGAVRAAFESKTLGDVIFRTAATGEKGTAGAWYFLVLRVPFVYYWVK